MAKLAMALTALFAFFAFTSQAETLSLSRYSLPYASAGELQLVAKFFTLERAANGGFEVQVPQAQAGFLRSLAPRAEMQEKDVSAANQARLQNFALTHTAQGYRSFDQVQAWAKALVNARGDLFAINNYGLSRGGRPLTALRLNADRSVRKPTVMITAATHGDELITTEVLIRLVERLADAYGKEDRLTKLVNGLDLYFIPVVNPDGFVATNRYDGMADPNRSYPYPGHENASPTPSIAGLISFASSLSLKASIDFHAFGELIMYPWAYTYDSVDSFHLAMFDALTKHMAEANRYTYGPIAEVIYRAPGSSADYYFWKKGSTSLGIEVGESKIPSPSEIPAYFASQEESTWRFLEGI